MVHRILNISENETPKLNGAVFFHLTTLEVPYWTPNLSFRCHFCKVLENYTIGASCVAYIDMGIPFKQQMQTYLETNLSTTLVALLLLFSSFFNLCAKKTATLIKRTLTTSSSEVSHGRVRAKARSQQNHVAFCLDVGQSGTGRWTQTCECGVLTRCLNMQRFFSSATFSKDSTQSSWWGLSMTDNSYISSCPPSCLWVQVSYHNGGEYEHEKRFCSKMKIVS